MGLQSIDTDGNFSWNCVCTKQHTQHIAHEEVQWTGPHIVQLPVCECGERLFVKVAFTSEELDADNIKEGSHQYVQRHQELSQQLLAAGKTFQPQEAVPAERERTVPTPATITMEDVQQLILQALKEHGVIMPSE